MPDTGRIVDQFGNSVPAGSEDEVITVRMTRADLRKLRKMMDDWDHFGAIIGWVISAGKVIGGATAIFAAIKYAFPEILKRTVHLP